MPKLQGATQGPKPPLASKTRVGMVEHGALFVWIVSERIPQGKVEDGSLQWFGISQ